MSNILLTQKDLMRRLRVSQRTLDRLRANYLLPWLDVGNGGKKACVRFRLQDVEAFEEKARRAGGASHVDV